MLALGVSNLPTERQMDIVDRALQNACGIKSFRYLGRQGHVYYVNDLAGIIAQEMSNPSVRKHLHFYPEDGGPRLSETWQAEKWLRETDSSLLTPAVRKDSEEFYVLEPALLQDGTVCMPFRWFKRNGIHVARAWRMHMDPADSGWHVQTFTELEVEESRFLLSFPSLALQANQLGYMHPSQIVGEEISPGEVDPWTKTNAAVGNPWRAKAKGKRVLAFPIWLYCDDTSGNQSKKWNKHNSFLFTAAGLPRKYTHRETNVHFLCTSNTAPTLEMLEGIVEQLEIAECGHGIVKKRKWCC
ncbi:hypothetical protein K435DRAFT_830076 [Dendrothele bispora CBS 962.96]|uniref:Uncharacterized protein n=1 Tax=Dendrothele bispora (strain CBS 962.96) TaxID=1314807 RepID=A0A4S8LNS1_DENBC|nr:hypothetical protein K435DRAFT_830076 [Dendrothele bispora CBS 962.96]